MFKMGANLDDEIWDTQKEKKSKKDNLEIIPKNQHQLVFRFEKRRGKPVTLVGCFFIDEKSKKNLLKLLKSKLGCGGTIKDEWWIEIQGDKKDKIKDILTDDGWKFR